jgi:hypothetical protein
VKSPKEVVMTTGYAEVQTLGWITRPHQDHSPFGWLARLGLGLVSFFASPSDAEARRVTAHPGIGLPPKPAPCNEPITPVRCCHLACAHKECSYTGSKGNFHCPTGYIKTYWTCSEGSHLIGCGECASGNNCGAGPWYCSIWWYITERQTA